MAGGTLPQKGGGGNLKHNELIAPKMVCDKREGTTQGAPILLPRAQRWHAGCQHWDSAYAWSCPEKDATFFLPLFPSINWE